MAKNNELTKRQQQEVAAAQDQMGRRTEEYEYEGKASAQVTNKPYHFKILL
jgi:hypothetical protein